jgi:uracil-DNA glycosylase
MKDLVIHKLQLNKQRLLDQIAADIIINNVCQDLAKQAKSLVFGLGNPDADIMLIGEAPGAKEDELGQPFVGASGKFLDKLLSSIHLSRGEVYITNIVKYRPPKNRDPKPSEKQEFLPYLFRQIQVINPKLIVCLGRHSAQTFIPGIIMSEDRGNPKRISVNVGQDIVKVTILPLYHPATARFSGEQMRSLQQDFTSIPTILEKIRNFK